MKKLQCNFTTPEQSKRLLELGVPKDSADCYINLRNNYPYGILAEDESYSDYKFAGYMNDSKVLPCWSVGRLIEIAKICSKSRYALRGLFSFLEECEADECMFQVMDYFEICNYQFDFSKLEE